jgi:hypothetical protein
MNDVFNTAFEISLRVLLTLEVSGRKMSSDILAAADFITIYGRDFKLSEKNLHGNNMYRFSEFPVRLELVKEVVTTLVLDAFITAEATKDGFVYAIDTRGGITPQKLKTIMPGNTARCLPKRRRICPGLRKERRCRESTSGRWRRLNGVICVADFYFKRLSISGVGKETSIVEFEEGLNIVFGPSDTGKNYVIECIDFLFGADKFRFDPTNGYDTFMLLVGSDKDDVTIERKLNSKAMTVSSKCSDIESGIYTANWRKGSKKDDISDVWLRLMGVADKHEIIKNGRRDKIRLTLRQFSHMFLIKETSVLQESAILSPIQSTAETAAFSALYFFITGEDFADSTAKEEKKIREAKKKAVIAYMNAQLSEYAEKKAKLAELPSGDENFLQGEIERMVEELEDTERRIAIAVGRSKALVAEIYALSGELSESNTLRATYKELLSQYHGDVQRLGNIVDGEYHRNDMEGNTTCPFCEGKIDPRKEESYIEASQAELMKIRLKLEDLQVVDSDLAAKQSAINRRIDEISTERSGVDDLINSQLKPKAATIKQALTGYRFAIEISKEASVIGDMEGKLQQDLFRTMNEEEPTDSDFRIKSYYDTTFFKGMNDRLDALLKKVQYEKYSSVHVNNSSFDMVVNGQDKMIHGKGYRAFQNTIMALALAEFLAEKGTYAPSIPDY